MKVSQAVDFHMQYHQANSKKNTIKRCEFVLHRFASRFGKRYLASISQEEGARIPTFFDEEKQAGNQAESLIRAGIFLQFYDQHWLSSYLESQQYCRYQKDP